MAGLDLSTFADALKVLYPDFVIQKMLYDNSPLMAMLPKFEGFVGEKAKFAIKHANPQNRSSTFAKASVVTTSQVIEAFELTRKKDYAFAEVDNEAVLAANGDKGSFLDGLKSEIDGALEAMKRSMCLALYRDGSGVIGRLSAASIVGVTDLPLLNAEDIVNFEIGQKINFNAAATGTGTPRVNGGATVTTVYIVAVDRINGTFQIAASPNSAGVIATTIISDIAASDYVTPEGDRDLRVSGLDAWLPSGSGRAAALAASFYGVVRNIDGTKLGGIYYDGSALSIEEALIKAVSLVHREGGNPNKIFLNHAHLRDLRLAIGNKLAPCGTEVKSGNVTLSFKGVFLDTNKGQIEVYGDADAPYGKAYILQMDTWKFATLGKPMSIFDGDGLRMIRSSTADSMRIQASFYGNLGCIAPGKNAVCTLV